VPRPSYLVDTDWIIDHLCGIGPVIEKLRELEPEGLAISVISLAELYEGAHYSRDPIRSRASLEKFVTGVVLLPIDDGDLQSVRKGAGTAQEIRPNHR
jgi:tRNA(fMet)-specific endonuclease VapC